jgi:hypothetical protein
LTWPAVVLIRSDMTVGNGWSGSACAETVVWESGRVSGYNRKRGQWFRLRCSKRRRIKNSYCNHRIHKSVIVFFWGSSSNAKNTRFFWDRIERKDKEKGIRWKAHRNCRYQQWQW